MALFFGEGSMLPLAGSEIREALTRRLVELWGVGFLVVGLLLGLALISYDVGDPSHFSASGVAPRNWLGWVGAVVADP
ncbi:MAG: DNA translocase FtsK 4TM domain-containing protein, partial [Pseudomonadota bacterium]